jgi:hypothetical protein
VPLDAREVDSALTSKGFKKADRDHHFYYFWYNGKKTPIRTKISHGESEIHDRNCGSMARQIHLNRGEFEKFVECALTEKLYVEKLIAGKHLSDPAQLEQVKPDSPKAAKPSRSK